MRAILPFPPPALQPIPAPARSETSGLKNQISSSKFLAVIVTALLFISTVTVLKAQLTDEEDKKPNSPFGESKEIELEIPKPVRELHSKFLIAEEKATEPVRLLDANYVKHLEGVLKKMQETGKLKSAVEVKQEIDDIKNKNDSTLTAKDPDLNRLKEIYFRNRNAVLKNVAPRRIQILKLYEKQLLQLKLSLTKIGKLEEAIEVEKYTANLQEALLKQGKLVSFGDPLEFGKPNWDFIEESVKREKLKKVCHRPFENANYYDIGKEPKILVGFRLAIDDFGDSEIVRGLQPIFRGRDGRDQISDLKIGTLSPNGHKKVAAKENYAVGAIELKTAPFVRELRIHFYRIIGKKLDPDDTYSSEWYGNWDKPSNLEKVESGDRIPVGIHGRHGGGIDSLGIVLIDNQ